MEVVYNDGKDVGVRIKGSLQWMPIGYLYNVKSEIMEENKVEQVDFPDSGDISNRISQFKKLPLGKYVDINELGLTDEELFERKEQRIKEVAARVDANLDKPVRVEA